MNFELELEIIGLPRLRLNLRYYTLIFLTAVFFLSACSPGRDINTKYLINKQKIKGNKHFENWQLEEYLRLRRNKRVLGIIPTYRVYDLGMKKKFLGIFTIYDPEQINRKIESYQDKRDAKLKKQPKDSSRVIKKYTRKIQKKESKLKEGSWLAKAVGEPPAIYDSSAINNTAKQMQLYIRSNGYLSGRVKYKADTLRGNKKYKKVNVRYLVKEGEPHIIRNVRYEAEDDYVQWHLDFDHNKSLLKSGKIYKIGNVTAERSRINTYLKNYGFYKFKKQYISFQVDTSVGSKNVDITILVRNPETPDRHQQYKIRNIYFTIEDSQRKANDTTEYKGVYYIISSEKYSKKILSNHIHFQSGVNYELNNLRKSQKELGNIDVFKYININFHEVDSNKLDVQIYASPFDKYELSSEFGVSVNLQGQTIPGPFANLTFRDRNVFRGFEIFEANVRYSIEGQISLTDQNEVRKLREIGTNTSLIFPKILIPTKLKYKFSSFNPKSRLTLGFSDVDRQEYRRTSFKTALTYSWQPERKINYIVTPFDVNILNSVIKTNDFRTYLNTLQLNGNNLKQSFEPSIVSGFTLSRIYNNNFNNGLKNAWYNRLSLEAGGSLFSVMDKSLPTENNDSILSLPYYQFAKFQFDIRHYHPLSTTSTVVGRINIGAAKPYGASDVLPYEKFFFTGGSNSVRAWSPRRLGPGSYTPDLTSTGLFDYRFEQPGEILIEGNLELRGKLFSFVHGALFLDIGNVYTFESDNTRPGAQFQLNSFINDLAIGSGAGLRFDFSFLILRLDLGMKVKDPARDVGNRFVKFGEKGQFALNFGIGYPF